MCADFGRVGWVVLFIGAGCGISYGVLVLLK
jgi:hypothetical protein